MRKIFTVEEYLTLDPSQLANTILFCPECGKEHKIPIKMAYSGNNLISRLPEIIETVLEQSSPNIGVVYDRHIESKLEDLFFSSFNALGLPFVRCPLGDYWVLLDSSVGIGDMAVAELPKGVKRLEKAGTK